MPTMPDFPEEPAALAEFFQNHGEDCLPGLLGIDVVELNRGHSKLSLQIEQKHLASNGYLHAATVIALADTACGYGCVASFPAGASGFTTLELKSNHLGTALSGVTHGRSQSRPWWPHDPGLGCRGELIRKRQAHCAVPLHPADPLSNQK